MLPISGLKTSVTFLKKKLKRRDDNFQLCLMTFHQGLGKNVSDHDLIINCEALKIIVVRDERGMRVISH